ncbi:F-box protein At4g00755 [Salvia miltiorrhiza]|uniref:F-box protein At4g00755 n=1 Tax=Salvia miltiorrhiza TaxID=226208 RepID=UPI0025AC305B|nr:F-box protein At4g00755 [Salvia miltiorrhiza]XP_057798556.1 F-box protein At4g00755 [Salvia miltiorrhiza]XP_057798557.1 F-box protein At4g00755 [Salvia miltiorrhiza]
MDEGRDFVQWLGQDMSVKILMCLDDPCDLVRTSAVSRSWREFVIANGLCKKLCLRKYPEASSFASVVVTKDLVEPTETGVGGYGEWAYLEREHRVYAFLGKDLITSGRENCITDAVCASSTDNYPDESIKNTLQPSDRIGHRASYWSSKGASDPSASETLIYKLASRLCLITELHVHPFQAYFQFGFPIYSPKAVRFHMGYSKDPLEIEDEQTDDFKDAKEYHDEMFVWTYSSPEFPTAQENFLQKFKLPKPVLCIGGFLKVELLGRVQTQEMDGLYYICINHVQVIGRPLSPVFDVEIDDGGKCTLKYNPVIRYNFPPIEISEAESSSRSHFHRFSESIRTWEQLILNTFRGAGPLVIDDYDSDYEYLN